MKIIIEKSDLLCGSICVAFSNDKDRVDNGLTAVRHQEGKEKKVAVAPKGSMRSLSVKHLKWEAEALSLRGRTFYYSVLLEQKGLIQQTYVFFLFSSLQ